MVLNPFARRRPDSEAALPLAIPDPVPAAPAATNEPDPAAVPTPATTSRPRRGSRGGRGRGRAAGTAAPTPPSPAESAHTSPPPVEPTGTPSTAPAVAPATRSRRSRAGRARSSEQPEPAAEPEADEEPAKKPAARGRRPRSESAAAAPSPPKPTPAPPTPDFAALASAIEAQTREIQSLRKSLEAREAVPAPPSTQGLRVGVFVDAANVEKGREERRMSVDWGKVLRHLAQGRQLARAVAYAPISDDPSVSIETQRFVEPFLDSGYRVVTKPLKRFQGGAIKANLDIEIALDVVQMLDRLDVVCLVSGDGDFEALVEAVQQRGIRVEIVSFLHNTAANLRNAADEFIDLTRLREGVSR